MDDFEKFNFELLILCDAVWFVASKDEISRVNILDALLLESGLMCHCRNVQFVVHVSSMLSPPRQAVTIPDGASVTAPV